MAVLNPHLYSRLKRQFGSVKVSNQGEKMPDPDAITDSLGRKRLDITQAGEYYQVNCPYCEDTRHRLYINHMFGKEDGWGRQMTFLAICYNENCLGTPYNKHDFVTTLEADGFALASAHIREGEEVDPNKVVKWPGDCVRLDELRSDHKALSYLRSRDFDPLQISKMYGACYCLDSHYFLARDRIIVPVFEDGQLYGWQARYIGELPWKDKEKRKELDLPPKYFTCPGSKFRSHRIYNWDRMKQWTTGVLVEGPTDVWRGGSMFGCIFGNTATSFQKEKLVKVFRQKGRSLVLCLDPEEFRSKSTREAIAYFEYEFDRKGAFCAVKLPKGLDPGSMDRDFLKGFIKGEAAEKGVKVIYKQVDK